MKSGECVILNPIRLVEQVIACAPQEWSTGTVTGAVTGMLHRAVRHHLTYGECWSAIWPESDAEWMAVLQEWSQVFNEIDGRTLESVPEPVKVDPLLDADKARERMLRKELDYMMTTANLNRLQELIDQVSDSSQVTPSQMKWQITTLAARAYALGYRQACDDQ